MSTSGWLPVTKIEPEAIAKLKAGLAAAPHFQLAALNEGRELAELCSTLLEIKHRTLVLAHRLEEDRLELEGMLYRMREGRGHAGHVSVRLLQHRNEARAIAALAEPQQGEQRP